MKNKKWPRELTKSSKVAPKSRAPGFSTRMAMNLDESYDKIFSKIKKERFLVSPNNNNLPQPDPYFSKVYKNTRKEVTTLT